MWLFFTHSFDVGDVITYEGDRYEVVKIKLQYVVMKRVDGAHVIIPTNVMSSASIHNISRCAASLSAQLQIIDAFFGLAG